jgi:hypothetical protein
MISRADLPRVLLAGVRLTMGTAGLLAPGLVIRRLDIDPTAQPGMRYPLRMFGVRTVLIGAELLTRDPRRRRHATRLAPVVHGSDTVAALLAWQLGDLPRRAGAMATAISAVNLVLAVTNLAAGRHRPPARRPGLWSGRRRPSR